MGIVIDLVLVLILLGFIFWGYYKGLTSCLLKLLSFIIAVVIAFVFYKPVANYINEKTEIDDKMKSSIVNIFNKQEEKGEEQKEESDSGIQNEIVKEISENIKNTVNETKNEVVDKSAEKITSTVISAGSAIAIYLVARLILLIISFFIEGLTELPVIKQIDKTGGVIYGLIEGLLIIFILLSIVSFITLAAPENIIHTAITKSVVGDILYKYNPIINIIL